MSYRIAGVDVHKKMLAVVVSDVEIESEYQFERKMFRAPTTDSSEMANLAPPQNLRPLRNFFRPLTFYP